jgi:hypothetical protein
MINLIASVIPWEYVATFLAWLAGTGALLVGVWVTSSRRSRLAAEIRGLKEYQKTRKAIDNVEDLGDDPAILREWLRERGKRPGDL